MSDKIGGARVTHYHTVLMTAVTIGLGVIVKYAREAEENRIRFFPPFTPATVRTRRRPSTFPRSVPASPSAKSLAAAPHRSKMSP